MALAFVQLDDPAASAAIHLVLPHGRDALLEEAVVAVGLQLGRHLDVVDHGPEVLDGVDRQDGALVLLPGPRAVVLEEPEGPGMLEGMSRVERLARQANMFYSSALWTAWWKLVVSTPLIPLRRCAFISASVGRKGCGS